MDPRRFELPTSALRTQRSPNWATGPCILKEHANCVLFSKWEKVDSNHRSWKQQIYSLPPLATREFSHIKLCQSNGAGGRTRTPDLLITNQLLYQLSYTSLWTSVTTNIISHSTVLVNENQDCFKILNIFAETYHSINDSAASENRTALPFGSFTASPRPHVISCSPKRNRGDRTWTCGILVPNQALYQTELRLGAVRQLNYYTLLVRFCQQPEFDFVSLHNDRTLLRHQMGILTTKYMRQFSIILCNMTFFLKCIDFYFEMCYH